VILVFDLDDTLYPESTFVESGLSAVAHYLTPRLGAPAEELHERLGILLARNGRGRLFDDLLLEFGIDDAASVTDCVRTYREHTPDIELEPTVRAMLEELAPRRIYLVTDGDPDVQARKIAALGIEPYFAAIHRTWAYGREAGKPSLFCFELIKAAEQCDWSDVVYIADDPSKDFVNLRAAGALTVRVHTGRCANAVAAPGYDAQMRAADVLAAVALLGAGRSHPLGG
jgi:putative hydrolase of the HAD superfamily